MIMQVNTDQGMRFEYRVWNSSVSTRNQKPELPFLMTGNYLYIVAWLLRDEVGVDYGHGVILKATLRIVL